jgi:hypothetical protein
MKSQTASTAAEKIIIDCNAVKGNVYFFWWWVGLEK